VASCHGLAAPDVWREVFAIESGYALRDDFGGCDC